MFEGNEPVTVKPVKAVLGPEPKETIGILCNLPNFIMGQSVYRGYVLKSMFLGKANRLEIDKKIVRIIFFRNI